MFHDAHKVLNLVNNQPVICNLILSFCLALEKKILGFLSLSGEIFRNTS